MRIFYFCIFTLISPRYKNRVNSRLISHLNPFLLTSVFKFKLRSKMITRTVSAHSHKLNEFISLCLIFTWQIPSYFFRQIQKRMFKLFRMLIIKLQFILLKSNFHFTKTFQIHSLLSKFDILFWETFQESFNQFIKFLLVRRKICSYSDLVENIDVAF